MSTLSKNDDWTELDEQFKNLMQRIVDESSSFYDEPQKKVDYSFLDTVTPLDNEFYSRQKLDINQVKVKKKFHSFASRIAVIVFAILISGSGIAIWINSQPANALKFQTEKNFYEVKDGVFSTDEEQTDAADETCITRKYKSMEDMDKAKAFMPNLPVPEYIPEGYVLENLKIDKNSSDIMNALYHFKSGDKNLYINVLEGLDETGYETMADVKIVSDGDKKIYVWKEPETDSYGCSFIANKTVIYILGDISEDEMLNVAKKIK